MTATKNVPEEIELCGNCLAGLVFYLPGDGGAKSQAYCPKCGAKESGVLFVRKDAVGDRLVP